VPRLGVDRRQALQDVKLDRLALAAGDDAVDVGEDKP
jgi:hypothetical protein